MVDLRPGNTLCKVASDYTDHTRFTDTWLFNSHIFSCCLTIGGKHLVCTLLPPSGDSRALLGAIKASENQYFWTKNSHINIF